MFKIVRKSKIDEYESKIGRLELELTQMSRDLDWHKARHESLSKPNNELIDSLQCELRKEKHCRELAEAIVKALEDHLRVIEVIKK